MMLEHDTGFDGAWCRKCGATRYQIQDGIVATCEPKQLPPMMYDPATDEARPLTQADADRMAETLMSMALRRAPEYPIGEKRFSFRLAMYRNPARNDGVFVAEDKPIEPYNEGVRGLRGERLYPATPCTPYALGRQLPHDFASEIVRRWNMGARLDAAMKELTA